MSTTKHEHSPSMMADIRRELEALAAPLVSRLNVIDARLAELAGEATELKAARREIDAMLRKINPDRKRRRPGATAANMERRAARTDAVADFLRAHDGDAALAGGFTATDLEVFIKASDGDHPKGITHKLGPVLRELEDRGVVRLDRIAQGGGRKYKLA